jgi:16S rRNA G966 N2-methylase RsmD
LSYLNLALLDAEVVEYLKNNSTISAATIVLKGSPFKDISAQELAQQHIGLQKSKDKLPLWHTTRGILFPPKLNIEQTSSSKAANYKASLISGKTLIDITGGFGIDDHYFSKVFNTVTHCELNENLSALAAHNSKVLKTTNITFKVGDGIEVLKNEASQFDWIYTDPSRRDDAGGKVFKLSDCEPNIPKHLDVLLEKGKRILLKTSPLLDITAGLRELKFVSEIHIVAINNDVKELLWIIDQEHSSPTEIITVNFKANYKEEFKAKLTYESLAQVNYSKALSYLYEPNSALMKSGLFNTISEQYSLFKLHQNSHLYTSERLIDFSGRRFKILETLPFHKKSLKLVFKNTKANITTRNFPLTVSQLKSALQIKDGGTTYLFFTTQNQSDKVVLVCEKI